MTERFDFVQHAPRALQGMFQLENYIAEVWKSRGSLDHALIELVKIRVSQINGCAYCLDMHAKEAVAAGESSQRIYLLPAWRESDVYTPEERAALLWAEAITHVAETQVPDEVFDHARSSFSEQQLMDLTVVCVAINAWNRFSIAFRKPAGSYQVAKAN